MEAINYAFELKEKIIKQVGKGALKLFMVKKYLL
jgi:hypothetical protein